jgi:AbiTii
MEELFSLIDQIIDACTKNDRPLTEILRQCLVLASELKSPTLHTLAEKELSGYSASDANEIPNYRLISVGAAGDFESDGLHFARAIPPASLEPNDRWFATKIKLFDSIGYLEALQTEGKSFPWSDELVHKYASKLIEGAVLLRAQQLISKSEIVAVLHKLRTQMLMTLLNIKDEMKLIKDEMKLPEGVLVESARPSVSEITEKIVNYNFYGPAYLTRGDFAQIGQQVIAGDWESLQAALGKVGIPEDQRNELRDTMGKEKTLGDVRRVGSAATQERFST